MARVKHLSTCLCPEKVPLRRAGDPDGGVVVPPVESGTTVAYCLSGPLGGSGHYRVVDTTRG
jgi:hypothetical protein